MNAVDNKKDDKGGDESEMRELKETDEIEEDKAEEAEIEETDEYRYASMLKKVNQRATNEAKSAYGGKNKKILELIQTLQPVEKKPCCYLTGLILARVCSVLAHWCLALIPVFMSSMGWLNSYLGFVLAWVIFFVYMVAERAYDVPIKDKNSFYNSKIRKFFGTWNEAVIEDFFPFIGFAILIVLCMTMLSVGCITFDDSVFGVPFRMFEGMGWYISMTTSYMRSFKGNDMACRNIPGPCHFYMTLGYEASKTVYANMHLPMNITDEDIEVYYDTQLNYFTHGFAKLKASKLKYEQMPFRRFISFELSDLTPNTDYQISLKIRQFSIKDGKHYANYTVLNYMEPYLVNLP